MKVMKFVAILTALLIYKAANANELGGKVTRYDWNGIEVVYLQDNKFPSFLVDVYFSDGALSDSNRYLGETDIMFSQLSSGTDRYSQKEIADALEFYGSGFSSNVTHEYSTLSVGGLVKDLKPTLKMVCHIMRNATFPKKELKKYKNRVTSEFKKFVSNHGALADRAFRQLSLTGTMFKHPVEGYLKTIKRNSTTNLRAKLAYFNDNVKKKIYITGPEIILDDVQKIVEKDCKWKASASQFVRINKIDPTKIKTVKKGDKPKIYLVPVPNANQAKIRIGRFLDSSFTKSNLDLLDLASSYLGDGFTSKLMQTLRVKNGLTYGVYSYAGTQYHYGRAGISTSTKNETVFKILDETRKVIETASSSEGISPFELKARVDYLSGTYLFKFEKSSAYLANILFFEHIGRDYREMFKFPDTIKQFKADEVAKKINEVFNFNDQYIVVVGDKKLKKQLQKLAPVTVMSYKKFL